MSEKQKIALLIPVCSRNQSYKGFEDVPLIRIFLRHFNDTKESDKYEYKLFIGYDDDDEFYNNHKYELYDALDCCVIMLRNCQHNPVRAWNQLFEKAVEEDYDYYFQIGDDVGLLTYGWTTKFISKLEKQNNIGTVAPCEPLNYIGRKRLGKRIVNENNFVHKTHYDIFGYFFYPEIKNWYCDDWITFVYDETKFAYMDTLVVCSNEIKGDRYRIVECPEINQYIEHGQKVLKEYLKRCLSTITTK